MKRAKQRKKYSKAEIRTFGLPEHEDTREKANRHHIGGLRAQNSCHKCQEGQKRMGDSVAVFHEESEYTTLRILSDGEFLLSAKIGPFWAKF